MDINIPLLLVGLALFGWAALLTWTQRERAVIATTRKKTR